MQIQRIFLKSTSVVFSVGTFQIIEIFCLGVVHVRELLLFLSNFPRSIQTQYF